MRYARESPSVFPPWQGGASFEGRPGRGLDECFYAAAGRLVDVNTPGGTTEYAYSPWSSRASLSLPNDVRTTYSCDGLLSLRTRKQVTVGLLKKVFSRHPETI